MRIVLDADVLVSGLHNSDGAPGRIVDLILGGKIKALYDDRILSEYLEALSRPSLAILPEQAQVTVEHIRLSGERITAMPLPQHALPDPDDLAYAEVAITGKADALVTGNARHFASLKKRGLNVLSPTNFLEQFAERST